MHVKTWELYEKEFQEKSMMIKENVMTSFKTKNVNDFRNELIKTEKLFGLNASSTFPQFKELLLIIMEENPQFEMVIVPSNSPNQEVSFYYKGLKFMRFSGSLHDNFYQKNLDFTRNKDELMKKIEDTIQEKTDTDENIFMISNMLDNPKIIFDETFRKEAGLNTKNDDFVSKAKLFFETHFVHRSLLKYDVRKNMEVSLENHKEKSLRLGKEIEKLKNRLEGFDDEQKTLTELKEILPEFIQAYNFKPILSNIF